METGALTLFTFNAYLSTVLFNDRFHDGETQPVAFNIVVAIIPDAIEPLEDIGQVCGWNSIARILYAHINHVVMFLHG